MLEKRQNKTNLAYNQPGKNFIPNEKYSGIIMPVERG